MKHHTGTVKSPKTKNKGGTVKVKGAKGSKVKPGAGMGKGLKVKGTKGYS